MAVFESGEWDIAIGSTGAPIDPSSLAMRYTCGASTAQNSAYCNPDLDALFQLGRTTGVVEERQQAYWEAAMILHEELPGAPVATAAWIYGLNKGIGGIIPSVVDHSRITWNIEDWYIEE
jgi:ABC-type transport system substrate-binding protein